MIRHIFSLLVLVPFCIQSPGLSQVPQPASIIPGVAEDDGGVPLQLRIPAKMIAKSVNRDFEHRGPVNQVLLGTTSIGTSHCTGQVTCVVEDNPAGVSILCTITGIVESKTCGTNGPAIIHSTATTRYVATKRLTFDGKLFSSNPASVSSCTQLKINGIASTLPRLAGRLVIRVASARATESQSLVEAIIKKQTEEELCQRIDADFETRTADLNKQFASRLAILKYVPGANKQLRLRSRIDGVELAVGHKLLHSLESKESLPPIGESVEIWLMSNENLTANRPMTATLFSKVPIWLSTYFSENPLFQKPDERKWGIELGEKWIVLKLHE